MPPAEVETPCFLLYHNNEGGGMSPQYCDSIVLQTS